MGIFILRSGQCSLQRDEGPRVCVQRNQHAQAWTALHQASPSERDGIWHMAKKGGGLRPREGCVSESTSEDTPHCAHLFYQQSTSCISSAFVSSEITNRITSSDRAFSGITLASLNRRQTRWGGQNRGSFIFLYASFYLACTLFHRAQRMNWNPLCTECSYN